MTVVMGDTAHDTPDGGDPVKIGGKAVSGGVLPPAVTALDRVDALFDRQGRLVIIPAGGPGWTVVHTPVANVQATASRAAAGAGVRNVATAIVVTFAAGAVAPAAVNASWALRDGATGVGTILLRGTVSLPAVAGHSAPPVTLSGLWIEGTANTAMTLEFSAAAGANTLESVSLMGTTTAG